MAISIEANALQGTPIQLYLSGIIGTDFSVRDIKDKVDSIRGTHNKMNVHLSSTGGNIFDALAMYEYIKGCGMHVICIVNGICYAQAYILFLACHDRTMLATASLGTGELTSFAGGRSEYIRQIANSLVVSQKAIASDLATREGISIEVAMQKYFPKESKIISASIALESGLISEIKNVQQFTASNAQLSTAITASSSTTIPPVEKTMDYIDAKKAKDIILTAIKKKEITQSNGEELYKTFSDRPLFELIRAIENLAAERIKFLINMPYDELDKGNFLPELKSKYAFGFELIYYEKFGRNSSDTGKGSLAMDDAGRLENVIAFALKNNSSLTQDIVQSVKNNRSKDETLEPIITQFKNYAQERIVEMMAKSWDELQRLGWNNELKEKYFHGWKQKYKAEFGIEYVK